MFGLTRYQDRQHVLMVGTSLCYPIQRPICWAGGNPLILFLNSKKAASAALKSTRFPLSHPVNFIGF